jgi:hypothetical protein
VSFGDNTSDPRILEGWHQFSRSVDQAADQLFKDASGSTDGERTNAFRYLTQNLSQAFDIWLENRDTRNPTIHGFCGPTRKLGCDNADCIYLQSWINDTDTYVISGNKGTARLFNIALQGPWQGHLHEPFGDTPVGNIFGHELDTDWAGNFELWIGPDECPGDWLRSTPGVRKIFYRQYFDGWDEVPARLRIERVGEGRDLPPPTLSVDELLEAFKDAGEFVTNVTSDWPDTIWQRENVTDLYNEFTRHGGEGSNRPYSEDTDARKGRTVATLNWRLERDEALLVTFRADPSWFWQMTACSVFGASLEYRYRQVSLTSGMTPIDADGLVRIVVCADDPGYANWLDTQQHGRGWLYFRNMFTRTTPEFETNVFAPAELDEVLDGLAQRVTPAQRVDELRRRRRANLRRFPSA